MKGTTRFSHDEIVAATGLKIGDTVTDEDFKRASERLGETGMFTDVAYAFSYSASGTKLELQVTDSTKFVPVRLRTLYGLRMRNWRAELKSRVPLFRGEVPVAGSLLEQLNDALQALLLEKQLPGRVDYLRMAPENGGEILAINFTVNDVMIKIQGVKFPGAEPAEEAALVEASKKLLGEKYIRDRVVIYGKHEWLPIYLQRGHLRANFKDPQPRVERTGGKNDGGRVVGAGRARRSLSGGGRGVVRKQGAGAGEARLHHPPACGRTGERGAPERRSGSSGKIVRREGVHESENNPGNRV